MLLLVLLHGTSVLHLMLVLLLLLLVLVLVLLLWWERWHVLHLWCLRGERGHLSVRSRCCCTYCWVIVRWCAVHSIAVLCRWWWCMGVLVLLGVLVVRRVVRRLLCTCSRRSRVTRSRSSSVATLQRRNTAMEGKASKE